MCYSLVLAPSLTRGHWASTPLHVCFSCVTLVLGHSVPHGTVFLNIFCTWYLTFDSHICFCVVAWLPHTGATRAALWFRLREMAGNKEWPSLQKVVPAIRWLPHSLCATLCHCCGTRAHFATRTLCASHLGRVWIGTCMDSGHRSKAGTHRVGRILEVLCGTHDTYI